ncbi:MAG TPA: lipopolysaccharide heptosyltransferase II [Nevskiales bacterium]|nr:lipopolysaccharide heptosyltransferase II [Nevskiales bacterium]
MAQKILVVGPSWVGDMVMAQSLFITLRRQAPDCLIDVLAPGWSLPLIARMPEVRRGIEWPVAHGEFGLGKLRRLGLALRAEHYDRAIVLPRKLKAALAPWFARIPRRTGYRGELRFGLINDPRPLDTARLRQTVQRFVALGLERPPAAAPDIPPPRLRVDEDNRARLLRELGLDLGRPVVALMPGAEYGPAKQWPPAYFAQLAARLVAAGRQVWILGSAKEAALGDSIRAGNERVMNLCGRTRLADTVDLLSLCVRAVTNDSGLMHVAAAAGTPLVAIYGSSTPDYTPPLTPAADVLYLRLDCSPCFERTCPLGHYHCLRRIGVDRVLQLATRD